MKIPRSPVTKGQDRREAPITPSAATPGDAGVANPHYSLTPKPLKATGPVHKADHSKGSPVISYLQSPKLTHSPNLVPFNFTENSIKLKIISTLVRKSKAS